MSRGKMYPRCSQCDKLFSENGFWDDSITLTLIEAFPYCSNCVEKNGWKKCQNQPCNKKGDWGGKKFCPDCNYKKAQEQIIEESENDFAAKKKMVAEEMKKIFQQRINESFACRGTCGRVIPLEEDSYTWPQGSQELYCKNCITNKLNQEYDKKHNPTSQTKKCDDCQQAITGTSYYRDGENKTGTLCENCSQKGLITVYLEAIEKGLDITARINSSSKLSAEAKTNLLAASKIKKGEPVDIDSLPIDQEDKEFLKSFRQQNPPKNNPLTFDYLNKCQDCGKEEKSVLVGLTCSSCNSRNIETWKNGKLHNPLNNQETNPSKKKDEDKVPVWLIISIMLLSPLIGFFFYRWLWKKLKAKNNSTKN